MLEVLSHVGLLGIWGGGRQLFRTQQFGGRLSFAMPSDADEKADQAAALDSTS